MSEVPAKTARRFTCPACGRYIGATDGTLLDAVPCPCGWQTVVKLVGRIDKAPSRQQHLTNAQAPT